MKKWNQQRRQLPDTKTEEGRHANKMKCQSAAFVTMKLALIITMEQGPVFHVGLSLGDL